jgi:hypothetical protein
MRIEKIILLLICSSLIASTQAAIKDDILALTGNARAKIAWSRQTDGVNGAYGINHTFRLMRFDTDVGTEADVLGNTGQYFRAKITWDGNRILYNNGGDLWMVNWDGTNPHLVVSQTALGCYWYDNATGKEYVFAAVGSGGLTDNGTGADLYRINIANTTERTMVYNGQWSPIWMSVSGDGKKLAGNFPWDGSGSRSGLLDVATGAFFHINQYG